MTGAEQAVAETDAGILAEPLPAEEVADAVEALAGVDPVAADMVRAVLAQHGAAMREVSRMRAALDEAGVYVCDAEGCAVPCTPGCPRSAVVPADVDVFLRRVLAGEVYLRFQQAVGGRAVEEAARDIRMETNALKGYGVLEADKFRPCRDAADQIDPLRGGGPYPSALISFGGAE